MYEGDGLSSYGQLIALAIIFIPLFWWVWWMNKDTPKVKMDFGWDKPKEMMSWEGVLYILWNWKTYTAKTIWLVGVPVVWYQEGFGTAVGWFIFGGILVLMGKFWELFKR